MPNNIIYMYHQTRACITKAVQNMSSHLISALCCQPHSNSFVDMRICTSKHRCFKARHFVAPLTSGHRESPSPPCPPGQSAPRASGHPANKRRYFNIRYSIHLQTTHIATDQDQPHARAFKRRTLQQTKNSESHTLETHNQDAYTVHSLLPQLVIQCHKEHRCDHKLPKPRLR